MKAKLRLQHGLTIAGMILALQFGALAPSSAAGFAECVGDAAARDFEAKKEFQAALRDLIVRHRPEFESLASLNMELQIAYAQMRKAKFRYLLKHSPARIRTDGGLSKFTNFEWTKEDSERFAGEDAGYRQLEQRKAKLAKANNGHPDWPKLREYFHGELGQRPQFGALMKRFQALQKEVGDLIAGCPRP